MRDLPFVPNLEPWILVTNGLNPRDFPSGCAGFCPSESWLWEAWALVSPGSRIPQRPGPQPAVQRDFGLFLSGCGDPNAGLLLLRRKQGEGGQEAVVSLDPSSWAQGLAQRLRPQSEALAQSFVSRSPGAAEISEQ